MDEPKVPDDLRNWDSIDIFLFSNGQQYSPPRKYHLKADDITLWSATKNYLARSQFGASHSAVELYSLKGKKVEGPLELKNAAAYVAVEPPDAFIPAGYEKYLIKASRSREKRQEKLLSNEEEGKSDDMEMYVDLTKAERNEGIITLKTIKEDPITEPHNTINPPLINNNNTKISTATKSHIYPITKPSGANTAGSTIVKKTNMSSQKINSQIFFNKKNTPVLKNLRRNNNKQRNISSKNSEIPTAHTGDSLISKTLLKIEKDQITVNVKDPKSNIQSNTSSVKENLKQLSFSNKDLIAVSDVYKNNKNDDESSIIFTEREQKTTINDTFELPREFSKPNLIAEPLIPNSLETNKETSDVPIPEQIRNNKDILNIKVRIKLEDLTSLIIDKSGNNIKEETSFITLVKKEKASQVNIDVILSRDIFTYNNNLFLGKSLESCVKLDNEKIIPNNDNANNIFIFHCKCNNIDAKTCISNAVHYHKAESNDILVLSTKQNEETVKSCTCDSKKIEKTRDDIENQNSTLSYKIRNLSVVSDYKDVTKHKVSISQENQYINDSTIQSEYEDKQIIVKKDVTLESRVFIDKYVQTEWCNILLQAKCHDDGRYTFHLPALSLLKYYNMNQLYHISYLCFTQYFLFI